MIVIKIERKSAVDHTVKKNLLKHRVPTGFTKQSDYGNKTEMAFDDEYEVVEVTETENITRTLLQQEIEDENSFDLNRVILAINGLEGVPL
jgi:hypothetical protein